MAPVTLIIYRYLTNAEFFNLYKPSGSEARGGGQTYIDFPTRRVSLASWRELLLGIPGLTVEKVKSGERWRFPVYSIGAGPKPQFVDASQRRGASVNITKQRIGSRHSNRVIAWSPQFGFPTPDDPRNRQQVPPGLVVFLARTADSRVWAGWHSPQRSYIANQLDPAMASALVPLTRSSAKPGAAGVIAISGGLRLRTRPVAQRTVGGLTLRPRRSKPEAAVTQEMLEEDTVDPRGLSVATRKAVRHLRVRNQRAVRRLKRLYGFECQISGGRYVFRKRNGEGYVEAHHLVPLGNGGADDPRNIIIVSAHLHRMLHHADVSGLDLGRVAAARDGSASLNVQIDGQPFTVRWLPQHAAVVLRPAH